MNLKNLTRLAAGCALAWVAQLQAEHVRIDFNAVVASLSAPFVSEPLFNVGSTLSGYYIYDDSTALSAGAFPALIDFQATLTRAGSPIAMTSSNGAVRLSNNVQFPSGSGTTYDVFRIDANVPELSLDGAYINGLVLYARAANTELVSGSTLSLATPGLYANRFVPYMFSLQAPSGSFYGIEATGSFTYTAVPEPAAWGVFAGLITAGVATRRRRRT